MKEKMDGLTKAKLIYSGELMLFAIVFLVLGILKVTGVINTNATRSTIFNWITLFGGSWMVVDFLWAILSKRRRPKIALIDKIIHLPAGLYLISFDLYCLITHPENADIYRYGVSIIFGYLFLCYTFESIYHFFYPVPGLLDAIVEVDEKEENKEENKEEVSQSEEEKHE